MLKSRPQSISSPPFKIRQVTGANSPDELVRHIEVTGWTPTLAKIHVGNIEHLVKTLGGQQLYGEDEDDFAVVARELIQNARDSIAARRELHQDFKGKITLRIKSREEQTLLEVIDDGVGMSQRILTGPLLDFGTSFWATELVKSEFPGLKSSKFRAVGKFGIGFYSIFMIASKVQVSSRRFEAGLQDVVTLSFDNGLSLRPILSKGTPTAFSTSDSTKVTCLLPGPISYYRERDVYRDSKIPLQKYLARITAGLDVLVELQIEDEDPTTVHKPIVEISEKDEIIAWLNDLGIYEPGEAMADYLASNFDRLRRVYIDDRIVGFAAISDVSRWDITCAVNTIGGLTNEIHRFNSSFLGFLDHKPTSAKRDAGRKLTDPEFINWGKEQIDILKKKSAGPKQWCWVGNNLCDLGLDPISILVSQIEINGQIKDLSLSEIFQLLQTSRLAIAKRADMGYMDSFSPRDKIQCTHPLYRPIATGMLTNLEFCDGEPADQYSFIGCLKRFVNAQGFDLVIETEKSDSAENEEEIVILLLSAKPKTAA